MYNCVSKNLRNANGGNIMLKVPSENYNLVWRKCVAKETISNFVSDGRPLCYERTEEQSSRTTTFYDS